MPDISVASQSLDLHEVSTLTYIDNIYGSVVHPVDPRSEETKALFHTIASRAMHKDNWLQRRMMGQTDGDLLKDLDSYIEFNTYEQQLWTPDLHGICAAILCPAVLRAFWTGEGNQGSYNAAQN